MKTFWRGNKIRWKQQELKKDMRKKFPERRLAGEKEETREEGRRYRRGKRKGVEKAHDIEK